MSRREFSKPVRRQAYERAAGKCEGTRADGLRCDGPLVDGRFHYDHDIPDGLGGEPELWNCRVLCLVCHKIKTTQRDVPTIAKAKRVADRAIGIKKKSSFQSAGFQRAERPRTATRPLTKRVGMFSTPTGDDQCSAEP